MGTAVCSPASLAPRLDAPPVHVHLDAHDDQTTTTTDPSTLKLAASALSRARADMKGSDPWSPTSSETSTLSSRVTTPNPQPCPAPSSRHLLPPNVGPVAAIASLPLSTHCSGQTTRDSSSISKAVLGRLPPPRFDPPSNDARQPQQGPGASRPPPQPPPPQPPSAPHLLSFRDGRHSEFGPSSSVPPAANMTQDQMKMKSTWSSVPQKPHRSKTLHFPPSHPKLHTSDKHAQAPSQGNLNPRPIRRMTHTTEHVQNSESDLTTFSLSRPARTMSSSSTSSSEDDPIAYRNTRIFPPQLPAPPISRSSALRSRSQATNRITTWVSQYEKGRSLARTHLRATGSTTTSEQRSSAEDDGSVVSDVSSYVEVQLLWQQLKEKRAKVGDIKQRMAKRRQELRSLRRRQDEADNAFMSVIRPMLVNQWCLPPASAQVLDSRMTAMQDLRDEYRCRENDYEALEHMVDDDERQLNGLETRFFSLLAAGQNRVEQAAPCRATSSEAESGPPFNVPFELRGISADKPSEDLHPLYVELTSAVGDFENAKEEYQDLLYVKEQYEFESRLKWSTGKRTTAEADDFFTEFPAEEARMKGEVSRLETKVKSLKKLCESKKVMRKHMSVRMAYALDPHTKFEELELEDKASVLARRGSLAHAVFPEILSQPDHVLAEPEPLTSLQALRAAARVPQDSAENKERRRLAAKEYSIDSLMPGGEAGGRGDLVNRWLLQQLRQSPLNVQLLHSTFVASRSLRIRDVWRWQRDVLYYWWRDNTMDPADDTVKRINSVASNDASCPGTPQMSRAASDGHLGCHNHHLARLESDSAVTATG